MLMLSAHQQRETRRIIQSPLSHRSACSSQSNGGTLEFGEVAVPYATNLSQRNVDSHTVTI